jgi:hypothetical protein
MKSKFNKTDQFISKAKIVHVDDYDYSSTRYLRWNKKVTIICKRHGPFKQFPNDHLRGSGCPYCGRKRLNRIEFLQMVNEIHQGKYTYDRCDYTHKTRKGDYITITCPGHGDFLMRVDKHLAGQGCPQCLKNQRFNDKRLKYQRLNDKRLDNQGKEYYTI